MISFRFALIAIPYLVFLCAFPGWASGPAFVETGFGLNQMIGGAPYFGTAPSVTGLGTSVQTTLGYNFGWRTKKPVWVHAGIWGQLDLITTENSYTLAGIYPFLRLHIKRLFVTVGGTSFLWKAEGDALGFSQIESVTTAFGILGQIGYDWEITPEVSMLFSLQNQSILTSQGVSPSLLYAGTLSFRFYLFPDQSFQSRRRYYGEDQDPYPGWRYPYGTSK